MSRSIVVELVDLMNAEKEINLLMDMLEANKRHVRSIDESIGDWKENHPKNYEERWIVFKTYWVIGLRTSNSSRLNLLNIHIAWSVPIEEIRNRDNRTVDCFKKEKLRPLIIKNESGLLHWRLYWK